jgi:hypothetical protein
MTLSWRAWDATMKGQQVSAQPNRKQQRLARDLARRNGVSYQAALAQVRTGGPEKDVAADPYRGMLEALYEAFAPTGNWPLFQYISQRWDDTRFEARDVYLDLAEQGMVRPAMARSQQFQLRENTVVGASLHGLMRLPRATADLGLFVSAVRYVGECAADFRPASATELGRLSITSEQVRAHLGIKPGAPASTRLGTLMSDEGWQLWTSFGGPDSGTWFMEVALERARRYRNISTIAEFLAIAYPPAAALPAAPTPAVGEPIDEGSPNRGQPRAFISYSHQDEAFVLGLVQRLKERGIGVWIDRVDLVIGDSLIRRIGDAIHDEDFVIAVISEHSVKSSWCEKELSLAVTHGIQSKQVKILPVRLDAVTLPSFMVDTLWVEADRSDCTPLAAQLASAVERHLERRRFGVGAIKPDSSSARAAEQQATAPSRQPAGQQRNWADVAPMMGSNRLKDPAEWQPDIDRSVAEYDEWYLAESHGTLAEARGRAVAEVEEAMLATDDFRTFGAEALIARPRALFVARMCVSPPMTRDRFVGLSGANKSLVTAMERDGVIPAGTRQVRMQLQVMCDFLRPLLDPGLFCWLEDDRAPTAEERDTALLMIGERLASTFYLPALRNGQEAKQKELLRAYLEGKGFEESHDSPVEMQPGTFGFGRNVRVERVDGKAQNLPVDCVVSPLDAQLPLIYLELKSAGDSTNVNKRRREESDKHDALKRAHGDNVVFLLQLFGHFGRSYLGFEAAAGIDWVWDHRLGDLARYFGIE